jgi:cytochrome c-type biogenesis protein CcmE
MKTTHIIACIIIAVAIGIIMTTTASTSSYANFSEALHKEGKDFTVVGKLNRDKPISYNPQINANLVTFYVTDPEGKDVKVVLNQSKPQDLERSESIVVKGQAKDGVFYATAILLKCPSKYTEHNQFAGQGKPDEQGYVEVK